METTAPTTDYVNRYTSLMEGKHVLDTLKTQAHYMIKTMSSLSQEMTLYKYAEDKWTIKELFGHMIDTERIMSYRAMCISRGEKQSLPGFEENDYVVAAHFNKRSMESLLTEYKNLREANIALFSSLEKDHLEQTGNANGRFITAGTIIKVIAGHEAHHINILKERYLKE